MLFLYRSLYSKKSQILGSCNIYLYQYPNLHIYVQKVIYEYMANEEKMKIVTELEKIKEDTLSTKFEKRSFSETRQGLTDIINRVHYAKETFVVQKNGKDMAVIIPVEEYEEFQTLKEEKNSSTIVQDNDIIDAH